MLTVSISRPNQKVTVLSLEKNNQPISPSNPVSISELPDLIYSIPDSLHGEVCLISGFPQWLICSLAVAIKNRFSMIGLLDPKLEGYVIIHSIHPVYAIGTVTNVLDLSNQE